MSLSVGIVGLPNAGKSTLFNALLKRQQALVASYPFATIEPNVGVVPVPDERLDQLAEVIAKRDSSTAVGMTNTVGMTGKRPPIVPAAVKFVDIAGLVKGAHKGAGLGNQFLAHIREVDLICVVVRAFEAAEVLQTGEGPREDYQTVEQEMILKDLESLEKKGWNKLREHLNSGKPVREMFFSEVEQEAVNNLFLLTMKPEMVVINVSGDQTVKFEGALVVDAKTERGVDELIKKAYEKLGLISFLTVGEKEVRAWTIRRGSTALMASSVIHTDFAKKFIKAKVVNFDDFVKYGGWKDGAQAGKVRQEGREYVMQEGDVVEFMVGS